MSRTLLTFAVGAALAGASPALAATPFQSNRISVVVRGAGPDVVLVPGLSASRGIWNGTVAGVPGYRYHLVQVAGFAGTPAGPNATGRVAAPVAEEIARYIAATGLQKPAIVGHSMGGSIAMMLAARHPEAAGRVMVVDMLPAPAKPFGIPASAAGPIGRFVAGEFEGADRLRRDVMGLIGRFGGGNWLASRNEAGVVGHSLDELLSTDLSPELPRIKAPMTVVYACTEPLRMTCGQVGRVYASAYARRPGTRLVKIERSGHTVMWDQPAAFQSALRSFLTGL
jgi:pimeloyl-ACP methyl ester carboxylesterase